MKLQRAPTSGDIRIVHKFAWFPVTLSNKDRIWWEPYKARLRYYDYDILDLGDPGWYVQYTWQSVEGEQNDTP